MEHHFKIEIAKIYGVEEAILLHNIYYWVSKNKANNKHFYDGYYWTYNSINAFSELFPYWTKRQIERILNNLIKKEALIKGNYNKLNYDRTSWYAITQNVKSIYENREIHFTVWGNGNTQTVKPIPNSKTDNKPNNKKTYSKLESYFFCSDDWFLIWEKWLEYKSEIKSNYKTNLSESTAYKKLLELSNNNLEIADKIIMQSIENDWKGLFELKNNEKKGSTLNF